MEAKNAAPRAMVTKEVAVRRVIKIGRPGYKVRVVRGEEMGRENS